MIQLFQNYSSNNFGESYEFLNGDKFSKKQNKKALYIYTQWRMALEKALGSYFWCKL